MRTEKIVLSSIAIIIGLFAAGIIFFLYQSTKSISPSKIPNIVITSPTPANKSNIFLSIDNLQNESVVDTKTITINGKTTPGSTIVMNSMTDDQVVTPTQIGSFSITTTLSPGENQIILTSIGKSGEETRNVLTATYSTEQF